MKKNRTLTAERVVPIAKSNDDFDIKFWQRAGVLARFSATWKMIDEFYKMRGKHGYKLRLQRSVQHIQQA
jgi:hypothetical protein